MFLFLSSGTHVATFCHSANLKQVSSSTPSDARVKLHRRAWAHWIFAAVWSMPEKFWSIFVSEIHHTKCIFSLLTHCVRHKRHMSKINPKPVDLQNGKRMDSWCKYYLFLAYSGICLGLSKQFSPCHLRVFFKTPVVFLFCHCPSASFFIWWSSHQSSLFCNGKIAWAECVSPIPSYFRGGTARGSIPFAGSFKGLRIKLPNLSEVLMQLLHPDWLSAMHDYKDWTEILHNSFPVSTADLFLPWVPRQWPMPDMY